MEIINLMDLHNAILFLKPDAKFSIWDTNNLKEYMGDNEPIPMFDRLINWHQLNEYKCPTIDEIKNIDQVDFDNFILGRENNDKVNKYKDDLTLKANYVIHKEKHPNDSFLDYINYLEQLEV